jgi:hypothetical protein
MRLFSNPNGPPKNMLISVEVAGVEPASRTRHVRAAMDAHGEGRGGAGPAAGRVMHDRTARLEIVSTAGLPAGDLHDGDTGGAEPVGDPDPRPIILPLDIPPARMRYCMT